MKTKTQKIMRAIQKLHKALGAPQGYTDNPYGPTALSPETIRALKRYEDQEDNDVFTTNDLDQAVA